MASFIILLVLGAGVGVYLWRKGQRSPWMALRSGDYGAAATYRAWRLEQEQAEDNAVGFYGSVSFRKY